MTITTTPTITTEMSLSDSLREAATRLTGATASDSPALYLQPGPEAMTGLIALIDDPVINLDGLYVGGTIGSLSVRIGVPYQLRTKAPPVKTLYLVDETITDAIAAARGSES